MSLIYKTIFEIKLLHEYFLTGKDGTPVFEMPTQEERLNYLLQEFTANKEPVNAHISFGFPEHERINYESSFLKLVPSYSGCKVAMRVSRHRLADQSIVYKPLTPIGPELDIFIVLAKRTGLIDSYSSKSLYSSIPSTYFFSNENSVSARTYPFLTSNIPMYSLLHPYEQGELASFGTGDTREFYRDEVGDQWHPVKATALANEGDRLLVPSQFFYTIEPGRNVTQAAWTLKDGGGAIIKTFSVDQANPISKVFLDFADKKSSISFSSHIPLSSSLYTLEVVGNNGYSKVHRLLFNDELHDRSHWGVIHIKANPTDQAFGLFDDDGYLIKRTSPAGESISHRVFEIPVKSRSAYWRFINDRDKELKLITDLEDYLFKEGKMLLTKRPRPVSRDYFNLVKDGTLTNESKYVPNPGSYTLNKDKKDRICFDIRTPESALFPTM